MEADQVLEVAAIVTAAMVAGGLTAWLADLDFELEDTLYWRRWLGTGTYRRWRVILAALPAAVGVLTYFLLEPTTTIDNPFARALTAVAIVTAALRADARKEQFRELEVTAGSAPDAAAVRTQSLSLLVGYYNAMQTRITKRTARALEESLAQQRDRALTDPTDLYFTAQELASIYEDAASIATSPEEAAAADDSATAIYVSMDILIDPMATRNQRIRAIFGLYELAIRQFKSRRWSRRPVAQNGAI